MYAFFMYQHMLMLRSLPERVVTSMCIYVGISLLFIRRMQAGTLTQDLHTFCNQKEENCEATMLLFIK